MNKIAIVFLVLILATGVSNAQIKSKARAEAAVERQMELRSNIDTVTKWLENHKGDIYEASGIEVLENLNDGKIKAQRVSKRGTFVWVSKETVIREPKKVIYKSVLAESIKGGIVYSDTTMTVTSAGKGTVITIISNAGVNNPVVASGEMQMDMKVHVHKVEKLIERNLR